MGEARGDLDLTQESTGPQGDGEIFPEHLEGHQALVPKVFREEDRSHTPPPQFALDGVPVR